MKFLSTLAAAFMALRATTAVDATEHVERGLILGGTTVPIGKKLYAGGIRYASGNISFCGCVLISPIHVLTNAPCANPLNAKFVALGTHYNIGNRDGEELRVISAQNHTQYNPITGSFDLAILTLERPSKFASDSIKLPKHDDSDIVVGMQATNMGWGFTKDPDGEPSYELQSVSLPVWSNADCLPILIVDHTFVCAGGEAGKDTCWGDNGGPLIVEHGAGDADDVLIGISSWGLGTCGTKGQPSAYSRVSAALPWIYSVTKGQKTRQ